MHTPIHTNTQTPTNAHAYPICRNGMYTPSRSLTFPCLSRQAKAQRAAGGLFVGSLSRPTPYPTPSYRQDYAPHTTPLSSACVPLHLPLSSKAQGRCFGFARSYRTGLHLGVWSRAPRFPYPHGLRLRLAPVDEIGLPDEQSPREQTLHEHS